MSNLRKALEMCGFEDWRINLVEYRAPRSWAEKAFNGLAAMVVKQEERLQEAHAEWEKSIFENHARIRELKKELSQARSDLKRDAQKREGKES